LKLQDEKNPIWLVSFLQCIKDLKSRIGVTLYQMTVKKIVDFYNVELGRSITNRTAYNYIQKSRDSGWIRKTTKIVKVYTQYPYENFDSEGYPDKVIYDINGDEIFSKDLSGSILVETGEKKLRFYELTEKSKQLMVIIEARQEERKKALSGE